MKTKLPDPEDMASIGELIAKFEQEHQAWKNSKHPHPEHPNIKVDLHRRTIEVLHGPKNLHSYRIELDRINSSAEFLDWILQLCTKSWCDGPLLMQFIVAMKFLCREFFNRSIQSTFCPGGAPMNVDWSNQTIRSSKHADHTNH